MIAKHSIAFHNANSTHIDLDNIEISHQYPDYYKRCFVEMTLIKIREDNIWNKITDLEH